MSFRSTLPLLLFTLGVSCSKLPSSRNLDGAGGSSSSDSSEDGGDGDDGNGGGDGDGGMGGATTSGSGSASQGGTTVDDPDVAPTNFACDAALATASPGMRRLTKEQYENSLLDLLAGRVGDEAALAVLSELAPNIALLPDDVRAILEEDLHGTYERLDQTVQQSHVDHWYEIAVAAGQVLSRSETLGTLVGDCATDGNDANDETCLEDFVRSFGRNVFRRPLGDAEVAHHLGFYEPSMGIDPVGFSDVIAGLLTSPQFLYQIEHAEAEVEGVADTFRLSAYELASRLSYHFWNTMPDARLFELAESEELLEDGPYAAEVERMWDDERTHETLRTFFREWMKLDDLPDLQRNNTSLVYQNFAGDALPSSELRGAMIEEVIDLLDYYTWQQPGGIEQIFTTGYSFAKSDELSDLYGVEAWDGASEPPSLGEGRPGLLTRAAFLSTGTANTRPVMKGVFIRRNILCDKIPPPPADVMGDPPELNSVMSTRQVVEELTEQPGTSCANCHSTLMNPLGFATEGFDGLGRVRATQQLFDDAGAPSGRAELDTSSTPRVHWEDEAMSEGPEDLMTLIVDSGKADSCAVRHYFRFSFGRWEKLSTDGCALESMRTALQESGSLAGMLKAVALADEFRRRTFDFEPATAGGEN